MMRYTNLRPTRPNDRGLSCLLGEEDQIIAESIDANTAKRICTAWNSHDDLVKALDGLLELYYHANPDAFKNGVTDQTGSIDQGDVYALDFINTAKLALKLARGE